MAASKTAPEAPAEKPKKKGKKKLMIIIAAVLLVVGGAGGYLMLSGGSAKSGKAAVAKPSPQPGIVLALDAITVNLAESHYLKVKLSLQLTSSAPKDTDGSKALDLAIAVFTDRTIADLSSAEGRAKAKEALLSKVEEAYKDEVMDIYFTQFVMQ
jgi:flagellar protein FliL